MIIIILKIIAIVILIAFAIWLIRWIITIDDVEETYLIEYEELKNKVSKYDKHTNQREQTIRKLFDKISKYKCKNYEKLQVLEMYFNDKIKMLKQKITV